MTWDWLPGRLCYLRRMRRPTPRIEEFESMADSARSSSQVFYLQTYPLALQVASLTLLRQSETMPAVYRRAHTQV